VQFTRMVGLIPISEFANIVNDAALEKDLRIARRRMKEVRDG